MTNTLKCKNQSLWTKSYFLVNTLIFAELDIDIIKISQNTFHLYQMNNIPSKLELISIQGLKPNSLVNNSFNSSTQESALIGTRALSSLI